MKDSLEVIVIYDKPRDFPDEFVARVQWAVGHGAEARIAADRDLLARGSTLEDVRRAVLEKRPGKVRIQRHPTDDPVIVESWI